MERLELYTPKLNELWFYQKMLSDPDTMSYNAGWDVDYDGYHRDTGCIDFPRAQWEDWHQYWTEHPAERFYAYLRRKSDGAFIGDVNVHYTPEEDWWDMGIVLYAPYRGRGYAVEGLKLLLERAFRDCGANRVHNNFAVERQEISAWETHRRAGFRELGTVDGFLEMMLTKSEWEKEKL